MSRAQLALTALIALLGPTPSHAAPPTPEQLRADCHALKADCEVSAITSTATAAVMQPLADLDLGGAAVRVLLAAKADAVELIRFKLAGQIWLVTGGVVLLYPYGSGTQGLMDLLDNPPTHYVRGCWHVQGYPLSCPAWYPESDIIFPPIVE